MSVSGGVVGSTIPVRQATIRSFASEKKGVRDILVFMILAVDFDGVIHDYKNPVAGKRMGAPILGAKNALEFMERLGHEVIIFTVWGGTEQGRDTIRKWMEYYEIPFKEITNIKPRADLYIDDKAVKFTNWADLSTVIVSGS